MKRQIKNLIFLLLSVVRRDTKPKVVFYHDIGKKYTNMGTDITIFQDHMRHLRACDVVCFDDGFKGVWDQRELLASLKGRVKIFLAIDLIGKEGYLSRDEIVTLAAEYGIDFQCHTWSHQTLAGPYNDEVPEPPEGRTEAWFYHELNDSKRMLEELLNKKVNALCFPVGYFSDDVIARCRAAGYEEVYASFPGDLTNEYLKARCLVQDLTVLGFKAVLRGGMNCLKPRYVRMHRF